jgi:hypothetical protein
MTLALVKDVEPEINPLIEETWKEIGIKVTQAFGRMVFVRTLPLQPATSNGLILPDHEWLYAGPAHLRFVKGLVLVADKNCSVKMGDTVLFQRLVFARWFQLPNQIYVGWVKEAELLGWVLED